MKINRFNKFVHENTFGDDSRKEYSFKKDVDKFGTKSLTTRQPPRIHAMLDMMSKYLPSVKKGEIFYEAVVLAFDQFETRLKEIDLEMSEIVDVHYIGNSQPSSKEEEEENTIAITKFDQVFSEFLASHDSSQLDLSGKSIFTKNESGEE